jgi:hypothetical protein
MACLLLLILLYINCSCDYCIFILCRVFIVCVVLCAVFRLIVVLSCVMCVICVLCLIVAPLPPGENKFAVKINNNNNNNAVFSNLPSLHLSSDQIFSSVPCSETPSENLATFQSKSIATRTSHSADPASSGAVSEPQRTSQASRRTCWEPIH